MYKCNGKIGDHLLVHFAFAQELWSFVFPMFGVQWVMFGKVLFYLGGQFMLVIMTTQLFGRLLKKKKKIFFWKLITAFLYCCDFNYGVEILFF